MWVKFTRSFSEVFVFHPNTWDYNWIAQLGSHAELSLCELEAVCGPKAVRIIHPQFATITLNNHQNFFSAQQLQARLGGTVKILKPLSTLPQSVSRTEIEQLLTSYLTNSHQSKVTFGLASFGLSQITRLEGMSLKIALKSAHIASRWIKAPTTGLSAAVLLHHPQIVEFVQIKTNSQILIAITQTVQDIDDWTRRDRGKPYSDHTKGMLPPKLARIMVNLALGQDTNHKLDELVVYDPFCGSGTILMEASLLGVKNLVGSDLDKRVCQGATLNLEWLKLQYGLNFQSNIINKDATHYISEIYPQTITHIVTEPFLGKQTPKSDQIPNIIKGLNKLYLGVFKRWSQVLVNGGRLVIILPKFSSSAQTENADFANLVKQVQQLGFNVINKPLHYSRPNAIVKRQIWQFKFHHLLK